MAGTVVLWYRRQFHLPPNDPRFLDLTYGEVLTEYWAHQYDDLIAAGKQIEEFDNPEFDDDWERFMDEDDFEDVTDDQ